MNNEKEEMESSQRQHDQFMFHNERMNNDYEVKIYQMFNALNVKLYKDGNMWCALYGEDIQSGICVFGKNPHETILNFGVEMIKKEEVGE